MEFTHVTKLLVYIGKKKNKKKNKQKKQPPHRPQKPPKYTGVIGIRTFQNTAL